MLDIKKLLGKLLQNQVPIYSRVHHQTGGNFTATGWIPFNTIEANIGGGTWSNGQYSVPVDGYYLVNFTCYSNSMTQGRVAVKNLNRGEMSMVNQNQSTSITAIIPCKQGDKLVAGAYSSSFSISIYAAAGHNSFTIIRLPIGGAIT